MRYLFNKVFVFLKIEDKDLYYESVFQNKENYIKGLYITCVKKNTLYKTH